MKNHPQKWATIVGLWVTAGLVLGACTHSEDGDASKQSETPMEISIAGFWAPDTDNSFVQKHLEQQFNVKFKNIRLDRANIADQLNVMLTSGQIPDIFHYDAGYIEMIKWAKQGIIASISIDEIKTYMPKYSAEMEKLDPDIWQYGQYNGRNWGVPKVYLEGATGFLPTYNSSWLKKIGYSEPPKTVAQLEDVLTKFTKNDPDGNGKNDTYGMSARGRDAAMQMFNSVFAAFGTNVDIFVKQKDGTLAYGITTEPARQALKLLNKWYKAGIIDPEFPTADGNRVRDVFVNGWTGYADTAMWYQLYETGSYGKALKAKGVSITIGPPVQGPGGEPVTYANGMTQTPNMYGIQLEKDEKKRIKILQMLEYMSTTEEGYLATSYGQEGVDYVMKGTTVIPTGDLGDIQTRAAKKGAGGFFSPFTNKVPSMSKFDYSAEQLIFKAKYTKGVKTLTNTLSSDVIESASELAPTLKSIRDTYVIKAIVGEADTDQDFFQFVNEWKIAGGQKLSDEANKLYRERQVNK